VALSGLRSLVAIGLALRAGAGSGRRGSGAFFRGHSDLNRSVMDTRYPCRLPLTSLVLYHTNAAQMLTNPCILTGLAMGVARL
jgi:hypothetical protein